MKNTAHMQQYFICGQDQIESRVNGLTQTGASEDGWSVFYKDDIDQERWVLTTYHSEYHGGGVPVLQRLPLPTISELIEIAMTSAHKDDIIGASCELYEREGKGENFRSELVGQLLQLEISGLSSFEMERIRLIIYNSQLYDATNRRGIVGRRIEEIQNDFEYFKSNAEKAKGLLDLIGRVEP